MRRITAILAGVAILALGAGCAPSPVRVAEAEATKAATWVMEENAKLDLELRQQKQAQEAEAHAVAIEATRAAIVADTQGALMQSAVMAGAKAKTTAALGNATSWAVYALGGAMAVSVVILAVAFAFYAARRAVLASQYVPFAVDPLTLLPAPLIVTADGWLLDTRSGQRCKLRDPAGVDRLRLAATTHSTEAAILAGAAKDIARVTRSPQAADALMAAVGALSILEGAGDGKPE